MNPSKPTFSSLLADAFPTGSPSSRLEGRILAEVPVRLPRRRLKLAFAATGIAFAAFGGVLLTPKAMAFAEIRRIEAAADALQTWRMTTYTPNANGQLVKSGDSFCRDGQVLEEREFGQVEILWSGNSVVEYRKGEDQAIHTSAHGAAMQVKKLSGFVEEFQRSSYILGLTVDREITIEGRTATRVSALSRNEPVRISIYADPNTDVPFLGIVELRSRSGWRTVRRVTIDASPAATSGQSFKLPSGVRVIDRRDMQQEWQQKLGKPIATYPKTSKSNALEIRDVWMNREGLIFVMYTNGRAFRPADIAKWKSTNGEDGATVQVGPLPTGGIAGNSELEQVENEQGDGYTKLNGFQGFETNMDGTWSRGLTWPQGDAQVAVFAPTFPQKAEAHRIKLDFGFTNYVVPKNFHPQGASVPVTGMEPRHTTSAVMVHTLKPQQQQLPGWAEFIGISPKPLELDAEVARVRGLAAVGRGEGQAAEAYARDFIRLTQMEAAESGNSYVMSDRYDLLGKALKLEGKTEEARRAWTQALDDAQPTDHDRIAAEISSLSTPPR